MPGIRKVLIFASILSIVGFWLWLNRLLSWPLHPVFALLWAASALHLGSAAVQRQRPEPFVLWSDVVILVGGLIIVAITYFRLSDR